MMSAERAAYNDGYDEGYQQGWNDGHRQGLADARRQQTHAPTPPKAKTSRRTYKQGCQDTLDAVIKDLEAAVSQGRIMGGIPPNMWKTLLRLVHPDRWQDHPSTLVQAEQATKWLLAHRPPRKHTTPAR